jgi:hypothetical protein
MNTGTPSLEEYAMVFRVSLTCRYASAWVGAPSQSRVWGSPVVCWPATVYGQSTQGTEGWQGEVDTSFREAVILFSPDGCARIPAPICNSVWPLRTGPILIRLLMLCCFADNADIAWG